MALREMKVRNVKAGEKQVKLSDGEGMYLLVHPSGGKYWRLKYRFGGKEKTLALGTYPTVSLSDARQRRADARKLLSNGVDPSEIKKAQKLSVIADHDSDLEVVAREWHGKFSQSWAASHAKTTLGRLKNDVFPVMGDRPIADIKAPELLAMLRRIESRGALETAHRVRTICGQIFRYAIATGRAEHDISADLKGALPPYKKGVMAAITDPKEVGPLLLAIDGYSGSHVVKSALQLAPLIFIRPGELRKGEWSEVDFDSGHWNIPAERMKIKRDHVIPLSLQAIGILKELHALTGRGQYIFPGHRSAARPMSENAVNAGLRRLDYDKDTICGHGFRAMARTILDEVLHFNIDYIEHQLAHAVRDSNGRSYNRTSHIVERRKMMQDWANYLDELKAKSDIDKPVNLCN